MRVSASPLPLNDVAVTIPLALPIFILLPTFRSFPTKFIPLRAVIRPTESIFFTSSYVIVPPTPKLPNIVTSLLKVPVDAATVP